MSFLLSFNTFHINFFYISMQSEMNFGINLLQEAQNNFQVVYPA